MKKRIEDIRVGPFRYRILYRDKLVEKSKKCGVKHKTKLMGRTDAPAGSIEIKDNLDEDMEKDTLIHEALHALWYASGAASIHDMDEESMVSLLAPWLLMLIRQNPELLEYLQNT